MLGPHRFINPEVLCRYWQKAEENSQLFLQSEKLQRTDLGECSKRTQKENKNIFKKKIITNTTLPKFVLAVEKSEADLSFAFQSCKFCSQCTANFTACSGGPFGENPMAIKLWWPNWSAWRQSSEGKGKHCSSGRKTTACLQVNSHHHLLHYCGGCNAESNEVTLQVGTFNCIYPYFACFVFFFFFFLCSSSLPRLALPAGESPAAWCFLEGAVRFNYRGSNSTPSPITKSCCAPGHRKKHHWEMCLQFAGSSPTTYAICEI